MSVYKSDKSLAKIRIQSVSTYEDLQTRQCTQVRITWQKVSTANEKDNMETNLQAVCKYISLASTALTTEVHVGRGDLAESQQRTEDSVHSHVQSGQAEVSG